VKGKRSHPFSSHRDCIGVVPQDVTLFNDTLGYNINYGRRADEEDGEKRNKVTILEEVTRLTKLDALIARLPQGLETPVGERGKGPLCRWYRLI
jgi:ATP-binding cassette subfamily B protein